MVPQLPIRAILLALPLTSFGCGSDPGVNVGADPHVIASQPHRYTSKSPEAPRETVAALQRCADRYAPRLSSDSYAILFDIEANADGQTAAVKIKDSMVAGSDLERCITSVLEQMAMPTVATTTRQNLSPQSRGMMGVVQVVAAPIALMPIVLVAAGVTILVGVTIYVASEAVDAVKESQRCRAVKEKCINHCSGPAGLPAPGGGRFRGCMRECMESHGCSF